MRKRRRDPLSILTLRRMALRAKRDPTSTGARQVLHDALLEQFGYYNFLVERVHRASEQEGSEKVILFLPAGLRSKEGQREFFVWDDNDIPGGESAATPMVEDWTIKKLLKESSALERLGVALRVTPSAVLVYRTRGYL